MQTISIHDLRKQLETGLAPDEFLVDVRTAEEHRAGHIPGATHWPLQTLNEHAAEMKNYRTVYFHCQSGGRSSKACEVAASQIPHAVNVTGGFLAWKEAGFPIETA